MAVRCVRPMGGNQRNLWILGLVSLACWGCAPAVVSSKQPLSKGSESAVAPRASGGAAAPNADARTAQRAERACEAFVTKKNLGTPESTVAFFVESIAANDFACALRTSDAEQDARRFDFTKAATFVRLWNPKLMNAPSEHSMFAKINELGAQAGLGTATKLFIYSLLLERDLAVAQPVQSDAEAQAFVQAVNPKQLTALRIVSVDQPSEATSEEAQFMFKARASRTGADEVTERVALLELAGKFYKSSFQLCRRGESWHLCGLGSYGRAVRTTGPEYSALLGAAPAGPPEGSSVLRPPRDAAPQSEQVVTDARLATPEAAVKLYAERISANDFAGAFQAYAFHEQAARFRFVPLVREVKVLNAVVLKAPPEYPMFVELNELRARSEMAQATKLFVYGLLTNLDTATVETTETEAQARAFIDAVNPSRLASLRLVRVDQPRQSVTNSTEAQVDSKRWATLNGADEMTERLALYELSGQLFWSGFRLCRFDKNWKIVELSAAYGGPRGPDQIASKVTSEAYEAALK